MILGLATLGTTAVNAEEEVRILTEEEVEAEGLGIGDGGELIDTYETTVEGLRTAVEVRDEWTSVTTYLSASCTRNINARTPYKDPWTRVAIARVTFSQSSGCSAGSTGVARIQQRPCGTFGCNWNTRQSGSVFVSPGQSRTVALQPSCTGNDL